MNTNKTIITLAMLLGVAASGCGPLYRPMAQHTLQAGENNAQDVVWINQGGDIVMRCQNAKTGPTCTTAQMK